jgi:Bor protein
VKRHLVIAALGVSSIAVGCFRTTVRSGHPPGPAVRFEAWHHGFVAGIIEQSGPYPLDQLCPDGWAEVRAKTDPLDVLLTVATATIYTPQVTTVVCAEKGAPSAPPRDGYRVPAVTSSSAYPPPTGADYPPPPPQPDGF